MVVSCGMQHSYIVELDAEGFRRGRGAVAT